jgi:hypothetical protein
LRVNNNLPSEQLNPWILHEVNPVTEPKESDRENEIAKFNFELPLLDKTDNLIKSAFKVFVVSFITIDTYEISRYPGIRPDDFLNDLINTLAPYD